MEEYVQQFIFALASAECEKCWMASVIPLAKFRDEYLPLQAYEWAQKQMERQSALTAALEQGLILIREVADPTSPRDAVTAICLNRANPAVQSILESTAKLQNRFAPVPIRGEALSDTVIRERR